MSRLLPKAGPTQADSLETGNFGAPFSLCYDSSLTALANQRARKFCTACLALQVLLQGMINCRESRSKNALTAPRGEAGLTGAPTRAQFAPSQNGRRLTAAGWAWRRYKQTKESMLYAKYQA
jgi:hypothetical protein